MQPALTLAIAVLVALAFGAIFRKAGYSPWLGVLMLVPLVNLIVLLWFAFTPDWPVHRRLAQSHAADPAAGATAADEELALNEAVRLETRGEWDQAVAIYERLADRYAGRPTGTYAAESPGRLREREIRSM